MLRYVTKCIHGASCVSFAALTLLQNHFSETFPVPLDHLKIGTRLILAFGGIALLMALIMAMGMSRIGQAEDAYRSAVSTASDGE